MIILACETSTLLGSVAVIEDGRVLASVESMRQGSHSDILNTFTAEALKKAGKTLQDVDLFATGIGPGSFTGIRICLNTIKSFAYCFQKPVVGISSLQTLAEQAHHILSAGAATTSTVVSMINAYKNMVYVATYQQKDGQLVEVKAPEVVRVQNLGSYVTENSWVCGDGYAAYEKFFSDDLKAKLLRHPQIPDEPHAQTLGLLATKQKSISWGELLPLYLRSSEAEENLKGIKYQPLN
ncbi:tRNA (adenosine(37)-N6)-threonylcarbamoyltransferase complex dimerization subunit type 1 TsaB [Pseudobdellovibrio exovorus]|uniref:Glycoprotein endopeptidase n=1 Tax=Pseudobdellovibrio exovorus JSS TaxID=1184267 RepID=M4V585_9BACT|nr:tRNA (adenosine(37)-N6)-threonylcarbamoyltransferase complex dimerization subunit type 1 TsaB [Pseudobdellovibrio exovorus]AGH94348.1 glycoprotein endopeptidase [Pseudobdellovibrio exovorus JSS]